MGKYIAIILLFLGPAFAEAQSVRIDRLKGELIKAENDSIRITIMQSIGFSYEHVKVDSSLMYYNMALNLARERSYAWGEARLLASLSGVMNQQGKLAEGLELLYKSLKIAEENNSPRDIARANRRIADIYFDLENFPKGVAYLLRALQIDEEYQFKGSAAIDHLSLADGYEKMNKLDSASFHINQAIKEKNILESFMHYVNETRGNIELKKSNYEQATSSFQEGLINAQKNNDFVVSSRICARISTTYLELDLRDSAIFYALKGFNYGNEVSYKKGVILNGSLLAELYEPVNPLLALRYFKIAANAKDSLFGLNNIQTIQNFVEREETKQKALEEARITYRNRIRIYGFASGLATLLIIALMLFRNNRQKQKANALLQQQKRKLETTLNDLKSTQAQLIQSEKMASLGELTAGIAHEIQNPLNFVNNFSEVSEEMIKEIKEERAKNQESRDEALIADNLADIEENLSKITHHGKRAGDIVKGMLEHSRKSTGEKVLTDLNALADEYLRLSYHGLRAKDKSFNADFELNLDPNLPKVAVIPQDIGRVLLNLINNGFYAVNEKAKAGIEEYKPEVIVSTRKNENGIEISVQDNGSGIPDSIKDKIFQPFFTTKPTGSGTGLGLSLSYDIIKAHGGELKVSSSIGEGTTFTIQIPLL